MGIWGWVQAIATGWFVVSILLAVAWALVGKRIFRKPPQPVLSEREIEAIKCKRELDQLHEERRGGER
ncbi:hypothetical protein [Streptomyces sp.]|uniref:hypothetical protein n=1 Tax=Streptomyces sp. TaxID=1931 RepID=UPI002F9489EB